MSGGFFRGTSADQDTRFSNKQAKLLKSQKFAPELEHLVDMTKVNMEVIKPWITKRVIELLGFEDEVLINFIHSLLDAKEVNGKEVQIQITGFMEKNTGKFMKELWALLLSAQKNASGVPQQFLDAKEEELRKKKVENDRITSEIQTKKDKEVREIMQERLKKMDGAFDAKNTDNASDPAFKLRDSDDRKETGKRNGVRSSNRVSRSPRSTAVPSSPHRISPSRSRSKSISNSHSYSGRRSRSISRSPQTRRRSLSSERMRRSPPRQSVSPHQRNSPSQSPSPRRKSSYSRRRYRSPPYRSPSPVRRRVHSPYRRRSPPLRRRGSPPVRRSPLVRRYRSPSPVHRTRSPSPTQQRRSPSPGRRRSLHERRRSPSPVRRRSPSPVRRRYRSRTPQRRSRSPIRRRSPVSRHKRSPSPSLQRSPSRDEWSSPSPIRRASTSPVRRISSRHQRSPMHSSRERVRMQERSSPETHRTSSPLRPLQREKDRSLLHKSEDSLSTPRKSLSESPRARNRHSSEDRRLVSPYQSPLRQRGKKLTGERSLSPPQNQRLQKPRHDISGASEGAEETYSREDMDNKSRSFQRKSRYSSPVSKRENLPGKVYNEGKFSPERAAGHLASESRGHSDNNNLSKEGQGLKSDKSYGKGSYVGDSKRSDDKNHSHINNVKDSDNRCKSEATADSFGRVDHVNCSASYDSGSAESDKHRKERKGRRKHKRSERKVMSSDEDDSYDSELEERKEAKRRKKEERKLRKEEKRKRREERRRRREERHAEKLKTRNKTDDYASDDEDAHRMDSHRSDKEETVSEQKKLEIELRNKALESFKAKRGMNH